MFNSPRQVRPGWWLLVSLIIGLSSFTPSALQPVYADSGSGVTWNTGTLREVYNPSGNIYTYAPSVIVDGTTEHIWTCHNKDDNVVRDHIFYTKRVNGTVVSSQAVLFPSASGWDSVHNCDPSVIRSNVTYNGTNYQWVMFYLGTDIECSCHNAVGVAFAQDIAGPWVKYAQNPIIPAPDTSVSQWGTGQQTATSIDGQGRILIFYRQSAFQSYQVMRRELNLSNMASPVVGPALALTSNGWDAPSRACCFVNFDVAYDPSRGRFYAVGEQDPFPGEINNELEVYSIDDGSVWNGGGSWRYEGKLTQATTGKPYNHNAGLKRTTYGMLPDANALSVVFAIACPNGSPTSLCNGFNWTYDLWEITGTLGNASPVTSNRVVDAGFESQTNSTLASPWVNGGSGQVGVDYQAVKSLTGQNNGWISSNGPQWSAMNQTITVTPNTNYMLSAWVRTSGNFGNNGYLGVDGYSFKNEVAFGPTGSYNDGYKLLTLNFTSGASSQMTVYIGFTNGASSGSWVQVDEVRMVPQG